MSTQQTNAINYVNYDFQSLVTELQQILSNQSAWKDMYRSSTGQTLLELFAAVGNLVLYYIERRAEESYISTAQNYSSVVNLARLLSYIPTRNVSSTGPLEFSLSSPATSLISIPKWTPVTSPGASFLTTDSAALLPGQSSIDVTGIQGTLITKSYVSNGSANQEYNINDTLIENSNIYVYVGADVNSLVIWNNQSSFINSTNISQDYVLRPELDGTVTALFGNGVFGASPELGWMVVIKYVQSAGLAGNLYSSGLINSISVPIYDQYGVQVQDITVTNTDNFLGGADAETIEEIRVNAPKVFATGDRAVTKSDFDALISNYPGVADVMVYGENDLTPPNYDMYNQVRICAILQNWTLPTPTFEAELSTYLYTKSLITVRYSYVDPAIIYVVPELTVRLSQGTSISTTQGLIESAIQNQFILGTTTTLGQSVYQSDIVDSVESIQGVLNCHATLKVQKALALGADSSYTYAATADLLPVLESNVELWVGTSQVAIDNGANSWTNLGSSYTVTGTVNYITGLIGVNISPAIPAGSTIFVRYQQNNAAITINSLGDLVLSQGQICRWSSNVYDYIGY
jgi:Baseplate J-like protein